MARPTRRPRHETPISPINLGGLAAKKVELESVESPKERDHRLWKDRWSFLVHDVGASIVALLVLIALVVFSFATLLRAAATAEDRRFATSTLTAVGTAVAGFAFGKAKK